MLKAKKSLGQNFLIDKNIIKKILEHSNIKGNNIVEIGPGTGNLTAEIIKKDPKSLILIEKDNNLAANLEKLSDHKIKVFNNDILKFDLDSHLKEKSTVIGNLPYNIASQILIKLIKIKTWPPKYERLIFMFQKEVANRILGLVDTPNYSRLTVISKWRLKVVDSFNVSSGSFKPKPKVESTVIIFEPINNKKYKINNIKNSEEITQIFFSSKRKMINKSLNKIFNNNKEILEMLKIKDTIRPSQLTVDEYYKITELYEKTII